MKNLNKFLLLSLAIIITSCNDAIDIPNQDGELLDENTFQNVVDLQRFLDGEVYSGVDASIEAIFTASFTDEIGIGPNNGGQEIDLHRFFLNTNEPYAAALWVNHHATVNGVNRFLKGAATVTPIVNPNALPTPINQLPLYNNLIAQARAIRAYANFQLITYFSKDASNNSDLGGILFSDVPGTLDKRQRSSNADIYAQIEADLLFADANITTTNYKFVTKNFISALRARMYLYRKDFVKAEQFANLIVSTPALALTVASPFDLASFYSATPSNPYRRLWSDVVTGASGGGEIIFALSRPSVGAWNNIASRFFFNVTTSQGGCYADMGRNLFNALDSRPGDVRRLAFVDPSSILDPNYLTNVNFIESDVIVIDKFPGKPQQPLRNDVKVFRTSEMIFILAECAVARGDFAGAGLFIKRIRDARTRPGFLLSSAPIYSSAQAAWADILDERRIELCFEGHRYIDLKRLGVLANRSIDRNVTDDPIKTLPLTISNTDYRFTMPIPQQEIDGNSTIIQNAGY